MNATTATDYTPTFIDSARWENHRRGNLPAARFTMNGNKLSMARAMGHNVTFIRTPRGWTWKETMANGFKSSGKVEDTENLNKQVIRLRKFQEGRK